MTTAELTATPPAHGDPMPRLSPSRAADFMQCPLMYRFRVIDRLPDRPTPAAVRGTVVHAVLERLFDLPAAERNLAAAEAMIENQWKRVREASPELAEVYLADPDGVSQWLAGVPALLSRWFDLEDPTRLEPAERELYVQTRLDDGPPGDPSAGLMLHGYVDRLDVAPDGRLRVVDYKTGRAPREAYEAKALFQMKFYALVLWRLHGVVPAVLQLVYLGNGEILRYAPDEDELLATERKLRALWAAIELAVHTGDWRASPGRMCSWCAHQELCPAFGGTPPPVPGRAAELVADPRSSALRTPGLEEE